MRIGPADAIPVSAGAAADVIHLLTEVVDNALAYSSPTTTVDVRTSTTARGLVVEVTDAGLGIPPDQLMRINHALASGGEVTPETARRMGLFVVSRLSQRHGVITTLRGNAAGGTTAVVLLPRAILPGLTASGVTPLSTGAPLAPDVTPARLPAQRPLSPATVARVEEDETTDAPLSVVEYRTEPPAWPTRTPSAPSEATSTPGVGCRGQRRLGPARRPAPAGCPAGVGGPRARQVREPAGPEGGPSDRGHAGDAPPAPVGPRALVASNALDAEWTNFEDDVDSPIFKEAEPGVVQRRRRQPAVADQRDRGRLGEGRRGLGGACRGRDQWVRSPGAPPRHPARARRCRADPDPRGPRPGGHPRPVGRPLLRRRPGTPRRRRRPDRIPVAGSKEPR